MSIVRCSKSLSPLARAPGALSVLALIAVAPALGGGFCAKGMYTPPPSPVTYRILAASYERGRPTLNVPSFSITSPSHATVLGQKPSPFPDGSLAGTSPTSLDGRRIYVDRDYLIKDTKSDQANAVLSGAYIVRTRHADAGDASSAPHLNATIANFGPGAESTRAAVYVAYDSRATVFPSWLATMTPVRDAAGNQLEVATTKPDLRTSGSGLAQKGTVAMRLWKAPSHSGTVFALSLPGNSFGATWPADLPPGERATYFVIAVPSASSVTWTPEKDARVAVIGTLEESVEGSCKAASAKLASLNSASVPRFRYSLATPCTVLHDSSTAPENDFAFSGIENPRVYTVDSEATVDKKASYVVLEQVGGSKRTESVEGQIVFRYDYPTGDLSIANINARGGSIQLVLGKPADAKCIGQGAPCPSYRIKTGGLVLGVAASWGGKNYAVANANASPLTVQVDTKSKPYRFQITSSGSLPATGSLCPPNSISVYKSGTAEMCFTFSISGTFDRWNPGAAAGESQQESECARDLNSAPIFVPSASKDLDGNLYGTDFFFDYALATETNLVPALPGWPSFLYIPSMSLAFGVRKATLRASDTSGRVDTRTVNVAVSDSTPPAVHAPGSFLLYLKPSECGPRSVNIGMASARDTCSSDASQIVSHDYTGNGTFQPGTSTIIHWDADDARGNTTYPWTAGGASLGDWSFVKIACLPYPGTKADLNDLMGTLSLLRSSTLGKVGKLGTCTPQEPCPVQTAFLPEAVASTRAVLLSVEPREASLLPIAERLEEARAALEEAHARIELSNELPEQSELLRRDAADALLFAADSLGAALALPWPSSAPAR
jgi:hypothetical protein